MSDLPTDLFPTRWEALGATEEGPKVYLRLVYGRNTQPRKTDAEIENEYLDLLEATLCEPPKWSQEHANMEAI